jgi:hypothetical protein
MPIQFPTDGGACAVFAGRCVPEEADGLLEWLRRTPYAEADLASCTDLHTALAQLLIAGRVRLAAPPDDGVLEACLHAAGLASAVVVTAAPKSPGTPRKPRKPAGLGSPKARASWASPVSSRGLSGPPAATGGPDKPGHDGGGSDVRGHDDEGSARRPRSGPRPRLGPDDRR